MFLQATSKSVPLFMAQYTEVPGSILTAKEGLDYVYDPKSQKSEWVVCGPVWCRTPYGDSQVDSHTWVTPEESPVPQPSGPQ